MLFSGLINEYNTSFILNKNVLTFLFFVDAGSGSDVKHLFFYITLSRLKSMRMVWRRKGFCFYLIQRYLLDLSYQVFH
mgnify:CR=1 FL=1